MLVDLFWLELVLPLSRLVPLSRADNCAEATGMPGLPKGFSVIEVDETNKSRTRAIPRAARVSLGEDVFSQNNIAIKQALILLILIAYDKSE
jgi:hypothetical protein